MLNNLGNLAVDQFTRTPSDRIVKLLRCELLPIFDDDLVLTHVHMPLNAELEFCFPASAAIASNTSAVPLSGDLYVGASKSQFDEIPGHLEIRRSNCSMFARFRDFKLSLLCWSFLSCPDSCSLWTFKLSWA